MPAEPSGELEIAPSQRKLKALARLQSLTAKFSDGTEYKLHEHVLPGVTLEQVRQDLAGIRGSLTDAVIDERAR